MAAELRPVGRQTTPPGRAEERSVHKRKKQHHFFPGPGEWTPVPKEVPGQPKGQAPLLWKGTFENRPVREGEKIAFRRRQWYTIVA